MRGKILGIGVIRGKDDKRYVFDTNELQNAQGRGIDELVGSEVDFEVADGKAVSIYITEFKSILPNANSSLNSRTNSNPNSSENSRPHPNFNENSSANSRTNSQNYAQNSQTFSQNAFAKAIQKPISPQMQEIKNKAFGSIALKILGAFIVVISNIFESGFGVFLYCIGVGAMFMGFLMLYVAIDLVQRYSKSKTLLTNFVVAELIGFAVGVMIFLNKIQLLYHTSQSGKVLFVIIYITALIFLAIYNISLFQRTRPKHAAAFVFIHFLVWGNVDFKPCRRRALCRGLGEICGDSRN